jgi:hypothetical protein
MYLKRIFARKLIFIASPLFLPVTSLSYSRRDSVLNLSFLILRRVEKASIITFVSVVSIRDLILVD